MDEEERQLRKRTNELLQNLIGICTDIKFEMVNERLKRDAEKSWSSAPKGEMMRVKEHPVDLGTGGTFKIIVPDISRTETERK